MKKVLIVFLMFAYAKCYMGCTSSKVIKVTYDDLDKSTNDYSFEVMITDSVEFYFDTGMYRFLNDTIDGITEINIPRL